VGLADVTARVLRTLPPETRYAAAGRIAGVVARIRRVQIEHECPWRPAGDRLEIEDWTLPAEGGSP
jgi:hypothetical protein